MSSSKEAEGTPDLSALSVGERIYLLRQRIPEYRSDQGSLADAVQVRRETISAWENDRQVPQGRNLERLALALHVSEQVVLRGRLNLNDRLNEIIRRWEGHLEVLRVYDGPAAAVLERCVSDLKRVFDEGPAAVEEPPAAGKAGGD